MIRFHLLTLALFQLILTVSTPLAQGGSATREALTSNYFSAPLEVTNLKVQGDADADTLEWCSNVITQTFALLPAEHTAAVEDLTLTFDPEARRGLGGDNRVVIRCVDMTEEELTAVLIHEVGHVVDTGLLEDDEGAATEFLDRGQIVYAADLSLPFYELSWQNADDWDGSTWDFVSGYARSNPYEEFAESYVMYVLHGELFRVYAETNDQLAEKYDYFKELFDGFEYDVPEITSKGAYVRVYDVTRLDFDLESFLVLRGLGDS